MNATHISFIGGQGSTVTYDPTTTFYNIRTGAFTSATSAYAVQRGAAIVQQEQAGLENSLSTGVTRAWAIGGVTGAGVETNTVATTLDGTTWTTITTTGPSPTARKGAGGVYVPNCMPLERAAASCVIMIGGDRGGVPVSDVVWFLWVNEAVPRWEAIAAAQIGAPTPVTGAAVTLSPDRSTVFVFGGTTSGGASNDMYSFAPQGFADFTTAEGTNIAQRSINNASIAYEASTDQTWGPGGPNMALDGNLVQLADAGPPAHACTNTLPMAEPWWKVDLGATVRVDMITIYPRADCCTDRYFDYQLWYGSNNNTWAGSGNVPVPRPYPNLAGQIVRLNQLRTAPIYGRFFWIYLPLPGTGRILTVCEFQAWQRNPYVWRKLSGTANVALNKATSQSSIETCCTGGDPARAVDGITGNNYNTAPYTCTATANTGVANIAWWMVDLGRVYDLASVTYWPRTDCTVADCVQRNQNLNFYVGFSQDSSYDTACPNVPIDQGMATGGRTYQCPLRGRYVIIRRRAAPTDVTNIIHVCEMTVIGNLQLDQPSARSGMAYAAYRGHMVIYGGSSSNGFRVDDVRLFDMVTATWVPAFSPVGNSPTARALTQFLPIPDLSLSPVSRPATDILIYAGQSNSDVLTDANILRFASCAPYSRDGIAGENCTNAGTVCFVRCMAGFTQANGNTPVICREDGSWEGIIPPCAAAPPDVPTNLAVAISLPGYANASVSYSYPVNLGYYSSGGAAANVRKFEISAVPTGELLEEFRGNAFVNPSAWKKFAEYPAISNAYYFANGKLWLDTAAGSDYWLPTTAGNPMTVTGATLYRGLILHRDWPAEVDPTLPWSFEAQIEAGTLPTNAQLAIGIFDATQCPWNPTDMVVGAAACNGHMQFYGGLRKVNEMWQVGFESVGGRLNGWQTRDAALSPTLWVKWEYAPTGDINYAGYWGTTYAYQRFSFFYKYRAQDEWIRSNYYLDNSMLYNSTYFEPRNFRPAVIAKLWNGNNLARAQSSIRYLRFSQGNGKCANPGCTRSVPGSTLSATMTGLTPGASYKFAVRAATDAGFGPLAITGPTYTVPDVVPTPNGNLINIATKSVAYQSGFYSGGAVTLAPAFGNDGSIMNFFHTDNAAGSWWGIDMGVDYAAVKGAYIWNRYDVAGMQAVFPPAASAPAQGTTERLAYFNLHVGQDGTFPRNNQGWFARDLNGSQFQQSSAFQMHAFWNMCNGVPCAGSEAGFSFNGYGRYFFIAYRPDQSQYLHLREVAVYVPSNCPARTASGAVAVSSPNRVCAAGPPPGAGFGSICDHTCLPGFAQVSGKTTAVCNGEVWNSPYPVCMPTCADIPAPAYADNLQHELLNLNFDVTYTADQLSAISTLEPIPTPFSTNWAISDGRLNAFARIGCKSDAAAVFYYEKIRAMDGASAFTLQADLSSNDRAGLLFRIVDARNYYRVTLDWVQNLVLCEKFVNGAPQTVSSSPVTLRSDTVYTTILSVQGANINVTMNNKLVLQAADRQFSQGYVGVYSGSSAWFDNIVFRKKVTTCSGATNGERCLVTCANGLICKGPSVRTCTTASSLTTADWNPQLPPGGALPTHVNNTLCTLDAPVFPPATLSVAENSARSTNVGSPLLATSTSPQYPVQYLITAQYPADPTTGQSSFSIDFCSGQVKVAQPGILDYESIQSIIITVRAFIYGFDGSETYRNITISILNVDEPPMITDAWLYLTEGSSTGALVGFPIMTDPENSTVVWTLDVDGGNGRFSLNATTGALTIVAKGSNATTGFFTTGTGSDAPLNYEVNGLAFELVVTAQQTGILPGTVGNPSLASLQASGKVYVQLVDANDIPIINIAQPLIIQESQVPVSIPGGGYYVGNISIIDEDNGDPTTGSSGGRFNSTTSYSLVPIASYPAQCTPAYPATLPLADGMFTVTASGTAGPSVALQTIPSGGQAWHLQPVLAYSGMLVRNVYTLCVRADDGLGGISTRPVTVAVAAFIVSEPVVYNISLITYNTQGGQSVIFGGSGFQPITPVAPPRAWYSNGIYTWNSSSCTVLSDSSLQCMTVPGVGTNLEWTIWWDNRKPVLFANRIYTTYLAPTVTALSGVSSLSSQGNGLIVFTGNSFGPPNTTVFVTYGTLDEYTCAFVAQSNASISHTQVQCRSPPGIGRSMPWKLMVGGQSVTSATSGISTTVTYAMPNINTVTGGAGVDIRALSASGGQSIVISGSNFGPIGALQNPLYGVTLAYGPAPTGTLLPFKSCVTTIAHTQVTCNTQAGVGFNHTVSLTMVNFASPSRWPAANRSGLSYEVPTITRVYGVGSRSADTAGGQVILIEGTGFGPIIYPVTSIDYITYGHPGDLARYAAVSCRVSQEAPMTPQITCLTAEGVGASLSLAMSIGSQMANVVPSAIGYGAPQVTFFAGAGSDSSPADTIGGGQTIINGRNFGPADAYTKGKLNVRYSTKLDVPVKDSNGMAAIANVNYQAALCDISVPHSQLTCTTVEGAGRLLHWDVIVDAQISTLPTTTYAAPVINAIHGTSSGVAVTAANPDGGDSVDIIGSFFGPTSYNNSGLPLIQSITYGISGSEYTLPRSNWRSISHYLIRATLLPGTGSGLFFRVTVADQLSTSDPTATFAFAPPAIFALVPGRGPTYSSQSNPFIVTAITQNLPLRDPFTRITLTFGNRNPIRIPAAAFPAGDTSIRAATNAVGNGYWPDGSINITFPLPQDGGGLAQAVVLSLGPVSTTVTSFSTPVTNYSAFSYRDPQVAALIVTRARFLPQGYVADNSSSSSGGNGDVIACPFPSQWDPSSSWNCGNSNIQRLEVLGTDFTSASGRDDGVVRNLEILQANYTSLGVNGLGEIWNSVDEVFIYQWTHSRIVAFIQRRTGTLRIKIDSSPFWNPASPSLSQIYLGTFLDLSPQIDAITAGGSFPTVGGTIATAITIGVENVATADDIQVMVGPRNATLINPVTMQPFASAADVKAYILDQANLATHPSFNGVWYFAAVVPPGQGLGVPVQLFRIRGSGSSQTVDGSNTGFTVDYNAPQFNQVSVWDPVPGTWAMQTVTGLTVVDAATDGSTKMRVIGADLGLDPTILLADAYVLNARPTVMPCAGTDGMHTCYEFTVPAGEGNGKLFNEYQPLGFRLLLAAGNQQSRSVIMTYRAPVVTNVVNLNSTSGFPTRGGITVQVNGMNFGVNRVGRPDTPISVQFGRTNEPTLWLSCMDIVRVSHYAIQCTLPVGSGKNMLVKLSIAGLDGGSPANTPAFSYSSPNVTAWTITAATTVVVDPVTLSNSTQSSGATVTTMAPFVNPILRASATGGDVITIAGSNFGAFDPSHHCAFLTWAYRSKDNVRGADWVCNNAENWLGEGEVAASHVMAWDHDYIVISVPPGLGVKELQLSIRGSELPLAQGTFTPPRDIDRANNFVLKYLPPTLDWMTPQELDTEGGEVVNVYGSGIGPVPRNTSSDALTGEIFAGPGVPLNLAPSLPTAYLAIQFHKTCVSNARTVTGSRVPDSVTFGRYTLSQCASDILYQDAGKITLRSAAGIGRNRTLNVVIVDGPESITSAPLQFDYMAPFITAAQPNPVYLSGQDPVVTIYGQYFGDFTLSTAQEWTADEKTVMVSVGGISCAPVPTFGTGRPKRDTDTRGKPETVVDCTVISQVVTAGSHNVSLHIAGQDGYLSEWSSRSLIVGCGAGYYGHANETCVACPAQSDDVTARGAICAGYVAAATGYDPSRHTYPRPLAGWFNLNSSDSITVANGITESMMLACPSGFQNNGRDVCIVPCDPPESCLGDNHCETGYTSLPPNYRCSSCDKGYYKRAGQCIKCPDSPAALFIGFAFLVAAVAGVGFLLNKRQVNIAVISIGIDFFQVLAIFSQTRIQWPPVVKELLHVLSAFNLNIEIVAPECLIPDVSYKQKFWFIMLLPLSVGFLLLLTFTVMFLNKAVIKGREKKKWFTHKPTLVSSCLVLIYMLYLYLTRTIMDVFNCTPTMPPDGYTYLQVVFERCGVPGGTQMTLIPYAVAGLVVYTIGYPIFIAYTLYKNRETVMEDQLLRAKGVGNDRLSNPHAYEFRKMFGRAYFQFKPDWCIWIIVIIIRKLCIAVTAVTFNKNASFQMAACLLIMFVAYALQMSARPYMSPGDYDEVLRSHMDSSHTSAIHARLRAVLTNIETRGRKKVHKNLMNFNGNIDRSAVLGVLTGWLFNYNTVEQVMIFAAVIVCLMGIMYQANEVNTYYPESKDSVTAVVLAVIILAILYYVTVLTTEIVILYNERERMKRAMKSARLNAKAKKGSSDESSGAHGGRGKLVGDDGEINVGKMDTQMNPLFMNAGGSGGSSAAALGLDTIMAQRTAPPTELWLLFQQSYSDMHKQLEAANDQLVASKRANQLGQSGDRPADEPSEGGRAAVRHKSAFGPQGTGSAAPASASSGSSGLKLNALRSVRKVESPKA